MTEQTFLRRNLNFPITLNPTTDKAWVKFTAGETEFLGAVCLPTPSNITFSTGLDYGTMELGVIAPLLDTFVENVTEGGVVDGSIYTITDATNQLANVNSGGNKSLQVAMAQQLFSSAGLSIMGNKGGFVDNVAKKILKDSRIAINPNTELYFKNVALRSFSFRFTLVAKSEQESQRILDIRRFFEHCSHPSKKDDMGFVFKYPETFTISFYEGANINRFLPSIKKVVMTSFSHAYNSRTNAYNYDGSPVSVDFSLSFRELVVNTRENINELVPTQAGRRTIDGVPIYNQNELNKPVVVSPNR